MSAEIEEDESYFGVRRVHGKKGAWSWKKDTCVRYVKAKWLRLYASCKALLCERVAADYKGLCIA